MSFKWTLREWLRTERGVTTAAEVSRIIRENTGYKISIQSVCDLFNAEPKMLRVKTLKALCDTFYCRLGDFCEILPAAAAQVNRTGHVSSSTSQKRSLGSTVNRKPSQKSVTRKADYAAFFPNARNFS